MSSPIKHLIESLLVRFGTFLTALLLGYGIASEHVVTIVPAILVLVGVAIDIGTGAAVKAYNEWKEGR